MLATILTRMMLLFTLKRYYALFTTYWNDNIRQKLTYYFLELKLGGISSKELDEALMLETALFAEISEGASNQSLNAPQVQSCPENRVVSNLQSVHHPISSPLLAKRLLKEQQVLVVLFFINIAILLTIKWFDFVFGRTWSVLHPWCLTNRKKKNLTKKCSVKWYFFFWILLNNYPSVRWEIMYVQYCLLCTFFFLKWISFPHFLRVWRDMMPLVLFLLTQLPECMCLLFFPRFFCPISKVVVSLWIKVCNLDLEVCIYCMAYWMKGMNMVCQHKMVINFWKKKWHKQEISMWNALDVVSI